MKLLTIREGETARLGVKIGEDQVLDIGEALRSVGREGVPGDVMALLRGGDGALGRLREYVDEVTTRHPGSFVRRESELTFGPCVTDPGKIICIGLNYRRHAEETNAPIPQYPVVFSKFNNTLAGHGEPIPLPVQVSGEVDYEAELVIVIGRNAKDVPEDAALDYVFGYCCVNDLSARDLQMRTSQWLLGKSCDKFSPLGPYLVTADEVGDPNELAIQCTVNGEVRQRSNTSDMIFRCPEIVSYLSRHMTLYPGDIILTGTPEGVMLGYPPERRTYLRAGDIVEVEIERLGKLVNRMTV